MLDSFIAWIVHPIIHPIIGRIDRLEATMSALLDTLEDEVRKNRSLFGSLKTLLDGLVAQLAAAKTDPVQIQRILDAVVADSADLAAAVAENTPADPAPAP